MSDIGDIFAKAFTLGYETARDYVHDGEFPATKPSEEETKAEQRDPDELAKRMALIWEGGWDDLEEDERDYLRCAAANIAYYAASPIVPTKEGVKAKRNSPELWYVQAQDRPNVGNSSAYVDTEKRANYYAKLFLDTGYLTVAIHPPVGPTPTEAGAS